MRVLAEERAAKYPTIHYGLPPLTELPAGTWIGTYSYSSPKTGERWLEPAFVHQPFDVPQTIADSTRDYLEAKFDLPVKMRKSERAALIENPPPLLARPTLTQREHVYLDISSAYLQIMRRVGWNVKYWPNEYIGRGDTLLDIPSWLVGYKIVRAMLVSIGWPNPAVQWTGEKTRFMSTFSKFSNPALYIIVRDVLRGVALDMLSNVNGVVYINTDGYILPASEEHAAREVLALWGLDAKVKYKGTCSVEGVGAYRIGKHRTDRWGHYYPFNNLEPTDTTWLLSLIHI